MLDELVALDPVAEFVATATPIQVTMFPTSLEKVVILTIIFLRPEPRTIGSNCGVPILEVRKLVQLDYNHLIDYDVLERLTSNSSRVML